MKSIAVVISLLFVLATPSYARETWEMCLDEGDFSFEVESFLNPARVKKSGCEFRLVELGGKGKKLEMNVCDAFTHIDLFESIESPKSTKLYAGSAGCPAPLFGADIEITPGSGPEFIAARDDAFRLLGLAKKSFKVQSEPVNLESLKEVRDASSDVKLSCAELLLEGYLRRCETYAAKTISTPAGAPKDKSNGPLPPGIHPANIERKY